MWILNGGAQERLYTRLEGVEGERLQVQVYDRCLEKSAAFELPVEDRAVILDLAVEIGGALELHSSVNVPNSNSLVFVGSGPSRSN